jgi:hypothetical protein
MGAPSQSRWGYALLIGLFVWLITVNTNIPHLGVRLVAMLASVVALYNTARLTSPALWGKEGANVPRSKRELLRRAG